MLVKEIMTRDVVTVSPETSLKEVGDIFKDKRISGTPVVDNNGNIVGIVTLTDLMRILDRIYRVREVEKRDDMGLKLSEIYEKEKSQAKVKDIMTTRVISLNEDATIYDIMRAMFTNGVHSIPVIKDNKLVGIIGKRDLVYAFF